MQSDKVCRAHRRWAALIVASLILGWTASPVSGEEPTSSLKIDAATAVDGLSSNVAAVNNPYASMSLDELMSVQVTSVSGLKQSWFSTPAAIYVVTPEDIRHIGARSIPEALRIVPGLHVARIDARRYAITSRGFNGVFANKLQVLADGRSIYEPSFAGVYWDQYDPIMEDLDRIEVIRGPGATLWGSNAVNGVINITTKNAKDTQGWLISGGVGTEDHYFGQVRYGDQIDNDTWFRVWSKYSNRDATYDPATSGDNADQWDAAYGGFRLDHEGADEHTLLTLIGGFQASGNQHTAPLEPIPDTHFATHKVDYLGEMYGGYLLGRIDNDFQHDGGWQLQSYFDINKREDMGDAQERHIIDVDFRHHLKLGDTHDVLWGLGWRYTHSDMSATGSAEFEPQIHDCHLLTGFVQDTITLAPDRWFAMIGSKFEHNSFTGFEMQPSARLWWTPNERQTLWGSVSRAVRTPSLVENDIQRTSAFADTGLLGGGPPSGTYVPFMLSGNSGLKSEELLALELGYRHRFNDNLTIDVTGFINRYQDMIDAAPVGPANLKFTNNGSGESYGVELAADWKINPNWRVFGAYSYLAVFAHKDLNEAAERDTPQHQFNIRSQYQLNDQWDFNAVLYVESKRGDPGSSSYIPSPAYARLDVGLTWHATNDLEISIWGQNLLDPRHPEYGDAIFLDHGTEIQRSVYVQATYRF